MTRLEIISEDAKPWHLVKARIKDHFNIHQQYWYQTVGYPLVVFLDSAGYSFQSQASILHHFSNLVAPHLGAAPILGQPQWKSFMTDNHTPVELSWDFHTGTSQPTIRYSIEPIGLDAGTASDPHNNKAATAFTRGALQTFPDTDTTLFKHFQTCFGQGWTKDSPEGHRSTMFWAFDLKESATTNKAYFFPGVVAHTTNTSTLDVISDAINSAPECSTESLRSFDVFADFVEQHPSLDLEIDMLALDLIHVSKSRLKIYFRDRRTNFHAVREIMSLGGQIQGQEFETGIQNLKRLWDALLRTHDVPDDASLPRRDHRTAGILYNVEFRMNSVTPKVKVYIPVRHYAKSDLQIIGALKGFLIDQVSKQPDLQVEPVYAKRYSECLQNIL
ncbi:hypothetical protein NM208_g11091 [Fusarium decemcellulare]|uniref:Uncharacterized protein n=1 Tax=Fusarium decemcellulare TaxID=57161 RepID=A0ACC1RVJ3_9HYPO|nr:hypothetical protein NM208_g11091 [Fusarium decemcellulare]